MTDWLRDLDNITDSIPADNEGAGIAPLPPPAAANHLSDASFRLRTEVVPQGADDRRTCSQCGNLTKSGLCLAAGRGDIFAGKPYRPVTDIPRHCDAFTTGPTPWIH